MDLSTLRTLKNEYPTSSWALWSQKFPEDGCIEEDPADLLEFVTNNRDQLRPSIVLLSLNPSTKLPTNYQNFHSTDPTHPNDHDIKGFTTVDVRHQIECYRVWFHANWGANKDKIPALRKQLHFLRSEIINIL